ncbi:unnamed protein product [Chrysoparadoxa australica]
MTPGLTLVFVGCLVGAADGWGWSCCGKKESCCAHNVGRLEDSYGGIHSTRGEHAAQQVVHDPNCGPSGKSETVECLDETCCALIPTPIPAPAAIPTPGPTTTTPETPAPSVPAMPDPECCVKDSDCTESLTYSQMMFMGQYGKAMICDPECPDSSPMKQHRCGCCSCFRSCEAAIKFNNDFPQLNQPTIFCRGLEDPAPTSLEDCQQPPSPTPNCHQHCLDMADPATREWLCMSNQTLVCNREEEKPEAEGYRGLRYPKKEDAGAGTSSSAECTTCSFECPPGQPGCLSCMNFPGAIEPDCGGFEPPQMPPDGPHHQPWRTPGPWSISEPLGPQPPSQKNWTRGRGKKSLHSTKPWNKEHARHSKRRARPRKSSSHNSELPFAGGAK